MVGNININGRNEMIMNVFVDELKKMNKVIVFIDEIHTLIGARDSGPMDLANMLKPALDRGEVKAIEQQQQLNMIHMLFVTVRS